MLPQNYEFQGPTFHKGKLEGRLEGQIAMATANVLDFLEARGFTVSDLLRVRVQSSTDLEQLRRWVRRAAVITNADELFDE